MFCMKKWKLAVLLADAFYDDHCPSDRYRVKTGEVRLIRNIAYFAKKKRGHNQHVSILHIKYLENRFSNLNIKVHDMLNRFQ